ncbi:FAD-binding protein [Jatrophihabitans telluris]|uniref:FAD-binding protein n=1 Tax=Jatrophihabitans telluris TaxID=2038343 RepID=A0ABY4R270_9ACTN|nr:D-arabinono-1,4-lactone oxidase [Jatrophihabitans telluris]UQX89139.1 FAD-binding protein [Jatrophihabitans telluris]
MNEADQARNSWTNWAATYTVSPRTVAHPASTEEVAELIVAAGRQDLSVKAVGAGHSFTDIAATRGVLMLPDRLTGILTADAETGLVTVAGGTTLHELNGALWSLGLSMTNLGDIDSQTITGAISTGTHGTGRRFGGLATQVRGFQLVTAAGDVLNCSAEENPEIFSVGRIGLGALGVITAVTIQCEPAFALHAVEKPESYDALLETVGANVSDNDHFEFYWFPHTRRVLTKANNRVSAQDPLAPVGRVRGWIDDEFLSNTVFERINRITTRRPSLIGPANKIAARALSAREYTDRSYRVFASPRRVRFREMEYALPRKTLSYVIDEIDLWLRRQDERVGFPVEVRFAAADDIPLSTAYGRETCYIAVHQYHRRPFERYFLAVERIVRSVGGRPHWGKLHFRTAEDLAPQYPEFDRFLAVRQSLDPGRRFGNDYLRRVLGS